ncbi:MAG: hypothetical protein Q8S84_03730 [bacterium]|nr:hypothetical protein [bacterium]MDP3380631.1 hypothetical protein [bacterium]
MKSFSLLTSGNNCHIVTIQFGIFLLYQCIILYKSLLLFTHNFHCNKKVCNNSVDCNISHFTHIGKLPGDHLCGVEIVINLFTLV